MSATRLFFRWKPVLAAMIFGLVSSAPAPSAAAAPGLVWMVSVKALGQIAAEPGGPALVEQFFDNPNTFVLAPAAQLSQVPPKAIATINFASFDSMRRQFAAHKVDRRYGAVLYDCEGWEFTPLEEQQDPVRFHTLAAQLARDSGLKFIAAPATTLRKVLLRPGPRGNYPPFIKAGIVGPIAAVSDVFEIQAQGLLNPEKYRALVQQAAAQALAANPNVVFLAGLSTGPSGRVATAEQLYDAVQSTRSTVAGYWLNIPERSDYCPHCTEARPDIAARMLQMLAQSTDP